MRLAAALAAIAVFVLLGRHTSVRPMAQTGHDTGQPITPKVEVPA